MRFLLALIDRLTWVGALFASVAFVLLAAMLLVEVVVTSFFAWSQPWSVEYSTYLLAATLFLGSGWALRVGGHIRVTALTAFLSSGWRRLVDALATTFALGVVSFASWALCSQAIRTWQLGSRSYFPSETPLVYPQAMLALSFVLLTLAFFARLLRLALGHAPEAAGAAGAAGAGGAARGAPE